ncbi:MAG: hypothetical protein ACOCTG_01150 [Bacteroidota bacterium]
MDGVSGRSNQGVDLEALVATFDEHTGAAWDELIESLSLRFGREITLEAVLFLIGIQTRGRGYEPDLARDMKQNIIMEGTFAAFATLGAYEQVGMDEEGAWIWKRVAAPTPNLSIEDQERLLKLAVLRYFSEECDGDSL